MFIKLGDRIRMARKNAGLTQAELAEKIGKAFGSINNYERGHRLPDAQVLKNICEITGANPGWLLTGEEKQTTEARESVAPPRKTGRSSRSNTRTAPGRRAAPTPITAT